MKFWQGIVEFFRKKLVALKHRPQIIPIVFIVLTFIVFSFNLSTHSNSIMQFNEDIIAFYFFAITLASMMSIFSFLGVKKLNKKAIIPIVITVALLLFQVGLQIYYLSVVYYEIDPAREVPIRFIDDIKNSIAFTIQHLVWLGITLMTIAFLPLYAKYIKKINTDKEKWTFYKAEIKQDVNK